MYYVDLYRKSILSQLGKDAGNKSMTDYLGNITENYEKYLGKIKEQKNKPPKDQNKGNELYL